MIVNSEDYLIIIGDDLENYLYLRGQGYTVAFCGEGKIYFRRKKV